MEKYGEITCLLRLAGVFLSIPAAIVYSAWKNTVKYTWLFACIAGFCFFTVLIHGNILISYDDISDPNYETYKDWNTWKFILCDIKHLLFWTGIGVLNYFGFIRRNRMIRRLCIAGICGFLLLFFAMMVLCRVTSLSASVLKTSIVSTHFQ